MSTDLSDQLRIKLAAVLEDLNAGRSFNRNEHPDLIALLLTQPGSQPEPPLESSSWSEMVAMSGQRMTVRLARIFQLLEAPEMRTAIDEYAEAVEQLLVDRKALIARA
jgi:hypothetical protein